MVVQGDRNEVFLVVPSLCKNLLVNWFRKLPTHESYVKL